MLPLGPFFGLLGSSLGASLPPVPFGSASFGLCAFPVFGLWAACFAVLVIWGPAFGPSVPLLSLSLFCLGPFLCLPLLVCRGAFACAGPLAGVAVGLKWGPCCLLVGFAPLRGFFLLRGPCNARGPWVSWTGSQCGPAGFVTSGAFLLPGVWACCVGFDMAAAVAPFSTVLSIKSLPLSTDRANFSLVLPLPGFIFN